nr:hypothetical protein [Candidatus Bipolaricaulota bacterium]
IRVAFNQGYPEMKDIVRKLLTACEAGDRVAANLEAHNLQRDVTWILHDTQEGPRRRQVAPYSESAASYDEAGFPDLLALASEPLDDLAGAARRFDERLRSWLREHGVDLCEFASVEDLRNALR